MRIFQNWSQILAGVAVVGLLCFGVFSFVLPQYSLIPLWVILLLGVAPLTFDVLKKAWNNDFGADVLAIIALITCIILGEYLAGALLVLMLAGGETLEKYAIRKASSVLEALAERMPSIAHRKIGEKIEDIAILDIKIGDLIVVFPHETAPVDGIVREGHGNMDESYLTGEPYRIAKAPGISVISGAINGETAITIEATKLAADSRYATIMTVMHDAEQKRPNLRRLGDQLGAIFAPLALLLAFAAWIITGDSMRFLAVLVVATPCPLLIAIPVTIISAISLAAKRGIIIKDPTILEQLPTCRTAIFDKTGTLTYGKPSITEIIPASNFSKDELLQAAASLELYSKHPLAKAFLEAAANANLVTYPASEVSEIAGQGLCGMVNKRNWKITSRSKVSSPNIPPIEHGLECVILCDNEYAGLFRLRDAPREEGLSFIGHLSPAHSMEKIILLSGDRESEVSYLAETLGIKTTYSSQSPEQKVEIVRHETSLAPTVYMGDGINDAPALTAATVGIAFGQHNSITSEAAGAVILENTLNKVDELFHISISLRQIALQSAVGGMCLSLLGMGLASLGYLTPVQGAIAQEVIDILAIANALRLAWGPKVISDMR